MESFAETKIEPKYGTIDTWILLTGIGRRTTYDLLGNGVLQSVKVGNRTLINIEKGMEWLASQPAAQIKAPKVKTTKGPF